MYHSNHSIEIDLGESVAYIDLMLTCKKIDDYTKHEFGTREFSYPDISTIKIDVVDFKFEHLMTEIEKQVLIDAGKDRIKWEQ